MFDELNILAIILATVAVQIVGVIWYAPFVFGQAWLDAVEKKQKDLGRPTISMVAGTFLTLFSACIMAYILEIIIEPITLTSGIMIGTLTGVGFVVTTQVSNAMYQGQTGMLMVINSGYHFVSYLTMGAVLGYFG